MLSGQAFERRYVLLPFLSDEWKMMAGFWAPLGPLWLYIGSLLMLYGTLPLWVLVVTEWVVRVIAYPVREAQDTCRLWRCPPKMMHALLLMLLQSVLKGSAYRVFHLFVAHIARTDWSRVPFQQSTRRILPCGL